MKTLDPNPVVEESQAVARFERPESNGITPAQAKVEAVAKLTMSAYEKASELRLTKEETDALQAVFPDDAFQPGAAGKEHLIYIEHAHLRDRFNSVFGMGQWSIVPRNRWAEPFTTQNNKEGSRVYVEAMLVVRGCFVAEAVGAMEYYPHNAGQDYSDAVEGAKTAALRRCAKELGVGLQAWKKEFCEAWWKRRKNGNANTRSEARTQSGAGAAKGDKRPAASPAASSPTAARVGTSNGTKPPTVPTPELRLRFLNHVNAAPGQDGEPMMKSFCVAAEMLLPTESVIDLPLRYVPTNKREFDLWGAAMGDFESGEPARKPFVNEEPAPHNGAAKAQPAAPASTGRDPEWFMDVVCPVPRKGMKKDQYDKAPDTIGSMYDRRHDDDEESAYLRKRLFGLVQNFEGGWTKKDGTKVAPSPADIKFREALDAFADYVEAKGEKI